MEAHRRQVPIVMLGACAVAPKLNAIVPDFVDAGYRLSEHLLRLVDVPAALEARGYPPGLHAELHLDVSDDVLPQNNERFTVEVEGERASVRQGGRGELRIDVRGLAPLYTGHLSPGELKSTGYLDGPDQAIATAAALFAGPSPWMPDDF